MDNTPTYMAMGLITEQNGTIKQPSVRYFTDRNEAERQYHLYCAAACTSSDKIYTAMLMTTEGFILESKTWKHDVLPEATEEPTEPEIPTADPEAE